MQKYIAEEKGNRVFTMAGSSFFYVQTPHMEICC